MGKNFPKHLGLKLFGYFLLCLVSLFAVFFVTTTVGYKVNSPAAAPIILTGVLISVFTVLAVQFGLRTSLNLPKRALIYMLAYNVLIAIVKFILSPLALYTANARGQFSIIWSGFPTFIMLGILVFVLYLLVFYRIYLDHKRKAEVALAVPGTLAPAEQFPIARRVLTRIVVIGGVAFLLGGTAAITIIALFATSLPSYLIYIFTTLFGTLVCGALIVAVEFLKKTLASVTEQAIAVRDMAVMTSFFWVGVSFLAAYHALWIVYLIGLTTLWPLDTQSPE